MQRPQCHRIHGNRHRLGLDERLCLHAQSGQPAPHHGCEVGLERRRQQLLGVAQGRVVLNPGRRRRLAGFTLIELVVTMVIMVVLALLAVPQMRLYTINSRIMSTGHAFYGMVQMARTEAIRRNTPVELILTDQAATAANAGTDSLSTTGPNWILRLPADASAAEPAAVFIDGFSGDATGKVVATGAVNTISFNAQGALVQGGVVNFTHVDEACQPTGAVRCLRVSVAAGGEARLCDPQATASGDTRRC
ncbi:MAG: prepilin-type N-terminal cleavage/methylation domain-containing protein [Comamonadaceae bacterium]|nr:MAG: prepilin-type N-terminal cleavage/methylation domain-containing protein [Comamonadaceae bacterium]